MTTAMTHQQLAETAEQARRDLTELDAQLALGEIDEPTGRRLRSTYLRDLEDAERRMGDLTDPGADSAVPPARSRGRMVVGAGILIVGLATAVGLVGSFVQDRDDGTLLGVADNADFNPEDYSNATLEAVLTSIDDDPQALQATLGMRFRLAERYFTDQDFVAAFDHYRFIIESEPDPALASAALTRVAWIVWFGNGLTDLALDTIDQALAADGSNTEAVYVKAQILWCGMEDPDAAIPLLEQVLSSESIDPGVRDQVQADLGLTRSGQGCG